MKKGIITLLDILGWKGVWQKQKADNALQKIQDLIRVAAEMCGVCDIEGEKKHFNEKYEVISISDTIAIISYPFDTDEQAHQTLDQHGFIASYLVRHSILHGIPIRGATSVGEFSREGNVLIGPAVDEVASWYETPESIGVIFSPSVRFLAERIQGKEAKFLWWRAYTIPTKIGNLQTFCAEWPYTWIFGNEDLKNGFESLKSLDGQPKTREDLLKAFLNIGPITPDIYHKYNNTINFYDYMYEKYDVK